MFEPGGPSDLTRHIVGGRVLHVGDDHHAVEVGGGLQRHRASGKASMESDLRVGGRRSSPEGRLSDARRASVIPALAMARHRRSRRGSRSISIRGSSGPPLGGISSSWSVFEAGFSRPAAEDESGTLGVDRGAGVAAVGTSPRASSGAAIALGLPGVVALEAAGLENPPGPHRRTLRRRERSPRPGPGRSAGVGGRPSTGLREIVAACFKSRGPRAGARWPHRRSLRR